VRLREGLLPERLGLRAVGDHEREHCAHPEESVVDLEERAALHRLQGELGGSLRVAGVDHPSERHRPGEHLRPRSVADRLAAQALQPLAAVLHLRAEVDRDQFDRLQRPALVVEVRRQLGDRALGEGRRAIGAAGEDQRARQEPCRGGALAGVLEQLVGLV
jgi:hypothetical protein